MSLKKAIMRKNYDILLYLYERKNAQNEVAATQSEIVKHINLCGATVNKIFNELKQADLVHIQGVHVGRYKLTDKAVKFVKMIENFEKENV